MKCRVPQGKSENPKTHQSSDSNTWMILNTKGEQLKRTVSRVSLNGLEEPHDNPDVDGDDVEARLREDGLRSHRHEEGPSDRAGTKNENLSRMSVLGSETKGSRELVMKLVDALVHHRGVKPSVGKVLMAVR